MRVVLVLIANLMLFSVVTSLHTCQRSPRWHLSGTTFPDNFKTRIKFVALLRASCGFCQIQSKRLEDLEKELISEGITKISFVIVNPHETKDYELLSKFRNTTNIKIVQDMKEINVWTNYKGITDDMFIFDRCNRMVKQITLPESNIKNGIVKKEILKAYKKSPCGRSCRHYRYRYPTQSPTTLSVST